MNYSFINTIPLPSILVEKENQSIVSVNRKFLEFTDHEAEYVMGQPIKSLLTIKNFKAGEYENISIRHSKGTTLTGKLIIQNLTENGHDFLILSFLDFQKSDGLVFSDVFESVSDGIIVTDTRLNVLDVNQAFCQITGLTKKEVVGEAGFKLAKKFLSDSNLKTAVEEFKKISYGTSLENYEIEFRGKILSISIFIKKDTKYIIVTLRDVTEKIQFVLSDISKRKKAEKELIVSEKKLNSIVQGSESGILTMDENQEFTFINSAGIELFGYPENEILNHNFQKFLDKDSLDLVSQRYKKRQAGEDVPAKYRFTIVRKNGLKRRVEINSSVITGTAGKPITVANLTDVTEEEEKQNAVAEAQQRFNAFFNANTALMFIKDSRRRYLELNDKMCRFFDKPRDEILGRKDEDLSLREEIEPCPSSDKGVLEEKTQINVEEKLGERIYNVTKFPIVLHDEILIGGILNDITHRKKAEEELQMKDDAINASINAIGITDLEGRIIYVNDAAKKLWMRSREEILGQPLAKFVAGNGKYSVMKGIEEKGYSFGEDTAKRKDGSVVDVQYSVTLVKDKSGNQEYIYGSFIDISQRKRHEKLQKILLNISQKSVGNVSLKDFIAYIHKQLKTIVKANNFYIALYQKSNKLYNFPYYVDDYDNFKADEFENPEHSLTDYIRKTAKGQIVTNESFNKIRKSEGVIPIGEYSPTWVWMGAPIRSYHFDEVIGVLTVQDYNDNTVYNKDDLVALEIIAGHIGQFIERLKSIEELKKAKEKAEESDRLKSAFLANMSHEIRTPMNGILGFTNLLEEPDFTTEEREEFLESIRKSGNRMLNTVNDIIEISKIEVGEIVLKKKKLNINQKISEIIEFFKPEAEEKGLTLIKSLDLDKQDAFIETDESKIESVITNLVKNAIKYSDDGTIEFGYKLIQNKLEFYCKDEGLGISKERQEAIFNRFEQADISDTRAFQGSGLGLAITKAYTDMLGGEVWVESGKVKGSVFYFTLPIEIEE